MEEADIMTDLTSTDLTSTEYILSNLHYDYIFEWMFELIPYLSDMSGEMTNLT